MPAPTPRLLPPSPELRQCLAYNLLFDQDAAFLHKQVNMCACGWVRSLCVCRVELDSVFVCVCSHSTV